MSFRREEPDDSPGGKLFEIFMGRKRGERVGLFGHVSQSERVARASEATARTEAKRLRLEQQRARQGEQFHGADEIRKLRELRDSGILTEAEFQQKKTELLARM